MSRTIFSTLWRAALVGALALGLRIEMQAQVTVPLRDSYDVVELYGLQQDAEGTYREISTITGWQTKWIATVAHYKTIGWTEQKIGRMTPFCASYEDILWGTSANGPAAGNISRAPVVIGRGQFAVNTSLTLSYNQVVGNGPGNVYPNSVQPRGGGGTELVMYPDKWIVDDAFTTTVDLLGPQANKIYACFRTASWGSEGMVGAYQELCGVDNLHIRGQAAPAFVPGRLITAIAIWDAGSASKFGNIYCSNIDVIFTATRGTPGDVVKVTGMNGTVAAFLFLGTCDSMWHIGDIEVDDFPCVFIARAGFGRESGISLMVSGVIKVETGVTPESRGPWNGTILGDLRGRVAMDFGLISYATSSVRTESMLVLDNRHSDGSTQPMVIEGMVSRFATNANMIHEVGGGVYAGNFYAYDKQKLFYKRDHRGTLCQVDHRDVVPTAGVVGAPGRLGFQRWNGVSFDPPFSHTNRTPVYSYTGGSTPTPIPPTTPPTTPTCTYTYSTWGACTNGTQTRTVTSATPAGCTGTPQLSQPCTVAPVPSTKVWATTFAGTGPNLTALSPFTTTIAPTATWSGGTWTTAGTISTTANTKYPWTSGKADHLVFTGITVTGPFSDQHITPNHTIKSDGRVFYRPAFNASGSEVDTGVKLVAGTRYPTLTLPCPGGALHGLLGNGMDGGNGAVMKVEALEVWQ